MTSSASPAALPPAPVLRMRDPGELLAALPYLLGFHPCESLVVLAFGGRSGRRVGMTQRVDLPPPEHVASVCAAMASNALLDRPTGAAVLVVGGGDPSADGAGPPRAALVDTATEALEGHGVPVRMRAWSGSTAAGAHWACYDECGCAGTLPDPAATPLAATAVAAGVLVHADRAELQQLVAPVPAEVLRRRERLLTRTVDAEVRGAGEPGGAGSAEAVVDAALADAASGRLHLDDGRVLALALALADPLVRDAALVRCATPARRARSSCGRRWRGRRPIPRPPSPPRSWRRARCCAATARSPASRSTGPSRRGPGIASPACCAPRGRRVWRPTRCAECLRTAPLPPAVRARLRRRGRR